MTGSYAEGGGIGGLGAGSGGDGVGSGVSRLERQREIRRGERVVQRISAAAMLAILERLGRCC